MVLNDYDGLSLQHLVNDYGNGVEACDNTYCHNEVSTRVVKYESLPKFLIVLGSMSKKVSKMMNSSVTLTNCKQYDKRLTNSSDNQ